MKYQVIARKWRPQRFEDIVGQPTMIQTLQNAIINKRIPHAYLFAGPRGVGKTTTARVLAKALNCKAGPTPIPCCNCPSCLEITRGNSIDVLEIDAASNRGINEIREVREIARYNPARDRYKIFIIDEAHMLTTEAFNALLKTLEEPPPHVLFILATTEAHKMPHTVLSRCQQFDFRMIPYKVISDKLKHIGDQEKISISDYALQQLALASEGSMRDAQSLFDQLIAFSGNTVKDDDVIRLLGLIDKKLLENFTLAIARKDGGQILLLIDDLVNSGADLPNFCRKLIAHLRDLLIIKAAGANESLLPESTGEHENLVSQASHFSEEDLIRFFDILVKTENELKWSSQPRFHLEIGLLKLVKLTKIPEFETLISRFNNFIKQTEEAIDEQAGNGAQTESVPVDVEQTRSLASNEKEATRISETTVVDGSSGPEATPQESLIERPIQEKKETPERPNESFNTRISQSTIQSFLELFPGRIDPEKL